MRAHWAHVGMVVLHTLCCALPLAVSLFGLAASASIASGMLRYHTVLHERELWLLALSALLVAAGGFAEWRFMRGEGHRRISMLFAASLACFALNGAVIAGHRVAPMTAEMHTH